MKEFLKRKNILFSFKRYGVDCLGAMAQGLFCSLLIGTIIKTLGQQTALEYLVTVGTYAASMAGPAMAVSIGFALQAPPLVLFSLAAVGGAANELGGAGGPLAVLIIAILATECGKLVSKETKIDILVTPFVTIFVGGIVFVPCPGYRRRRQFRGSAHHVGDRSATLPDGDYRICTRGDRAYASDLFCGNLCRIVTDGACGRCGSSRVLCEYGGIRGHEFQGK